ncbi:MAG: Fe-S cluster assembly protein SufD [Myxococcales bacterium]
MDDRLPTGPWVDDAPVVSDWTAGLRRAGLERFQALGFPTTRDEAWKYTNLAPLARGGFRVGREAQAAPAGIAERWGLGGARVVIVDGHFDRGASRLGVGAGARLVPLGLALAEHRELVEPLLGACAPEGDAMASLNQAHLGDGLVLHVQAGVDLEEPIVVLHVGLGAGIVSHPRTLIALETGARARVVEVWVTEGQGARASNAVTEVSLADGATLEHCSVGAEGPDALRTAALFARVGRSATLRSGSYAFGAGLGRAEVSVTLGEGAECDLSGLTLVGGKRHADVRTFVDHAAPHGTSRQTFKGIAGGAGRTVFNGRVLVRPGAQKTDARQSSQNLLLSERAWADTRPQLEIFADDVKCAHGATVGQLDEEALFYLRARGIGATEAQALLTEAFAGEVLDSCPTEALRPTLRAVLSERLTTGEEMP